MIPIIVPWKALLGFFGESEALDFVKRQGVQLSKAEIARIVERSSAARRYVEKLPQRAEALPQVAEVPSSVERYLEALRQEPTFQEYLAGTTAHRFAMIEVAKLVTFQTVLNQEYLDTLEEHVPPASDTEGLVKFCLPSRKERTGDIALINLNPETNTFSIATDNLDFRVLGNVQGEDPPSGRKFVGFAFGAGLRAMSVAQYEGRYILKNGYHRAYALRKAGHNWIPVLLLQVPSYDLTGANRPGFFPVDLLRGPKPPILDDFFSPAAVDIKRFKQKMVMTVHAEVQAIPV